MVQDLANGQWTEPLPIEREKAMNFPEDITNTTGLTKRDRHELLGQFMGPNTLLFILGCCKYTSSHHQRFGIAPEARGYEFAISNLGVRGESNEALDVQEAKRRRTAAASPSRQVVKGVETPVAPAMSAETDKPQSDTKWSYGTNLTAEQNDVMQQFITTKEQFAYEMDDLGRHSTTT